MGELAGKSGIQQGLHNEGFELSKVNGKRTYDFFSNFSIPNSSSSNFRCPPSPTATTPPNTSPNIPATSSPARPGLGPTEKTYAAVGQDSLDWKKIFSAAKTARIKNYFVEMDLDLMKASVPYLKSLQV